MEKSEVVSVRLPSDIVRFIDMGIAQRVWTSRSEALRSLIELGLRSPELTELGIGEDGSLASGLALLSGLSLHKAIQSGMRTALLTLEVPLTAALRAGEKGRAEGQRIMDSIFKALAQLTPFWRKQALDFMRQSAVYLLAAERYGYALPEEEDEGPQPT